MLRQIENSQHRLMRVLGEFLENHYDRPGVVVYQFRELADVYAAAKTDMSGGGVIQEPHRVRCEVLFTQAEYAEMCKSGITIDTMREFALNAAQPPAQVDAGEVDISALLRDLEGQGLKLQANEVRTLVAQKEAAELASRIDQELLTEVRTILSCGELEATTDCAKRMRQLASDAEGALCNVTQVLDGWSDDPAFTEWDKQVRTQCGEVLRRAHVAAGGKHAN